MITKYVEFNVICDICYVDGCNCGAHSWHPNPDELTSSEYFDTVPHTHKGTREMRKIAKEHGWVHKDGKDICPKCYVNMS